MHIVRILSGVTGKYRIYFRLKNYGDNRAIILLLVFPGLIQSACAQKKPESRQERSVGGGCEGCEAVHEYGTRMLTWTDTLPDFHKPGPKMEIRGTIYKKDGKTPAKDVILYIYHTDQTGEYPTTGSETGWGKRHGYIRGWIKTGADGKYKFYTLRPGAYPGRQSPEHIHPVVKEPGIKEYRIDEYLFDDDPILSAQDRNSQRGWGGKGVVKTTKDKSGMEVAQRDIILGLNVPGYEE
jgi:protocatechuate 3,4-dioxygenase, beta subunit